MSGSTISLCGEKVSTSKVCIHSCTNDLRFQQPRMSFHIEPSPQKPNPNPKSFSQIWDLLRKSCPKKPIFENVRNSIRIILISFLSPFKKKCGLQQKPKKKGQPITKLRTGSFGRYLWQMRPRKNTSQSVFGSLGKLAHRNREW